MKLKKSAVDRNRLIEYGIKYQGHTRDSFVACRKTPQAICVKKLIAQGYREIPWSQQKWNEYYDACQAAGEHRYIGAGMRANIMKKDGEIIIIGRSDLMWAIQVIDI